MKQKKVEWIIQIDAKLKSEIKTIAGMCGFRLNDLVQELLIAGLKEVSKKTMGELCDRAEAMSRKQY